jgi:hypothetical protein
MSAVVSIGKNHRIAKTAFVSVDCTAANCATVQTEEIVENHCAWGVSR